VSQSGSPRITDVARLAGVSVATASRALSGAVHVRPDRQRRVLDAARQLGYRPNLVASNLRRGHTRVIAIAVTDIDNPHSAELVRDAENVAYERGYRLLLCNVDAGRAKQANYLRTLAEERVAGLLVCLGDPMASEISELLDLGIAVVAVEKAVGDPRAGAVTMDNVAGGKLATSHLLVAGHDDVAFIGGPTESATARGRLEGYQAAMSAAGAPARWQCGPWDIDGGRDSARKLLGEGGTPGAIVTANNLITVGLLRELRERRLRVPNNVAVVAFDDPLWADLVQPPLTTLRQPISEIARRAVEQLTSRIEDGEQGPTNTVLDFELVHRRSCGCYLRPKKLRG
jgi:LacI family transcriptional regulator